MAKQTLASKLCQMEGKKSQVKIGDMREVIKDLCALMAAELIEMEQGHEYDGLPEHTPTANELFANVEKIVAKYYKQKK